MNREVIEYNGIKYRHIEMTPERFSDMVKKFAEAKLNKEDFDIFRRFDAHIRYAELVRYEKLYLDMIDLCQNRSGIEDICEYIDGIFNNIGELIEPILEN